MLDLDVDGAGSGLCLIRMVLIKDGTGSGCYVIRIVLHQDCNGSRYPEAFRNFISSIDFVKLGNGIALKCVVQFGNHAALLCLVSNGNYGRIQYKYACRHIHVHGE